jgi:NTP pyrophosphatase (non-canonical NTP hydrolase)
MSADLESITEALRQFAREREWEQFNAPKNLACALSVVASELLEHFQWLTEEQSRHLPADKVHAVSLEAADVLLYLLTLADKLGIDLVAAAREKIAINAQKYPVELSRGTSKKYTEL